MKLVQISAHLISCYTCMEEKRLALEVEYACLQKLTQTTLVKGFAFVSFCVYFPEQLHVSANLSLLGRVHATVIAHWELLVVLLEPGCSSAE